jgi:dTDP-N-acetylfucosamine:lipid II N-acetylfucosaminyltransferase
MFLHLIGNDPKFPKSIKAKFEVLEPAQHTYVIIKTNPDQPENAGGDFKYVSSPEELEVIVSARKDWEGIIINGLLSRLVSFLPVLPLSLPVAYYIWGSEAYAGIFSRPDALYGPKTAAVILNRSKRAKAWISLLFGARARQRRECKKVAKHIDYGIFPIEEEVRLFMRRGLFPKSTSYFHGNVGWGTDFDNPIFTRGVSSDNILIGNSADPTNNHLDSFHWLQLQQIDFENRKVIVPLSYGGNEEYKKKVLTAGRDAFGDAFHPLLDFIPYPDYIDIVRSCRFVMMNHRRQQAAGNVFMALAFGATVYLNPDSTITSGLKRMGFHIRDINVPLKHYAYELMAPIGDRKVKHNLLLARESLSKEMGRLRGIALIEKLRELNQNVKSKKL